MMIHIVTLAVMLLLPFSVISAVPAGATSSQMEDVTLQLRWFHQFQFAGYYAALEKGFYREAGLNVEIKERCMEQDPVEQVISGQADFGVTNSELLLHYLQGKPVQVMSAIFQHSPLVIMARGETGIHTPHDLINARVKMTRHPRDVELQAMLAREGVDLNLLNLTDGEVGISDYQDPNIDALSAYVSNQPFYLDQAGEDYTILWPRKYGVDFYGDCLFTSQSMVQSHPEIVRAFHKASLEGWEYAMDNSDEIIELIQQKYNAEKSLEHLRFEADTMEELILPQFVQIGHINPGRWKHIARTFLDLGFIDHADLEFTDHGVISVDFLKGFIYDPLPPEPDMAATRRLLWIMGASLAISGVILVIMTLFIRQQRFFIRERNIAAQELTKARENMEEAYRQLEEEVNKASDIHKIVLPDSLPQTETIFIAAHYQPAKLMGGDSYNVIKSGNKLIIYVADVMGHGLDGAMISVFIKELIDSYALFNKEELYPQKILKHFCRQYFQKGFPEDQLICIFLGVIDLGTNELKYSSAGFQAKPLVMMGNGEKKSLHTKGLFISNTLPPEIMTFKEQSLTLTPGTTVLITTDGLTEQGNGEEMFLGYHEKVFYENSHLPPEAIVQAINKEFCLFNHNSLTGSDDITYMVLQVNRDKKEKHHFEINSSFDELESLYEETSDIVKRLNVEFPGIDNLILCFHEVVINAIEHGNKFDPNKKVYIDLTVTPEYVLAEVEDEGEGFDWCEKIGKPIDMGVGSDRGRGIPITRMLSGNLFYNDKGNKVTLVVEVNKEAT